jgi:hypothetical protein
MATTSTAALLLEAWERGRDASPGERGLILLGVAHPEASASALSKWPVGRRDAALLDFCERLFGPRLAAQTTCPRCAALLDLEIDIARFSASTPHHIDDHFVFEFADHRVTYRLPNAGDLAALDEGMAGGEHAPLTRRLLRRCILRIDKEGAPKTDRDPHRAATAQHAELRTQDVSPSGAVPTSHSIEIPVDVASALESEITGTIAAADPLAEIALETKCPECAVSWSAPFDIVSFLWEEVHAWGAHVLEDVHVLASSYGWSETEILSLNPKRRQHYRDLIGS